MHAFCLVSVAGTHRAPLRVPRQMDHSSTMKVRRRNAVQRRRLALEVRGIERNMASLESERDRELRRLRDELTDMREPPSPARLNAGQQASRYPAATTSSPRTRRRLSESSETDTISTGARFFVSRSHHEDVSMDRFSQRRLSNDDGSAQIPASPGRDRVKAAAASLCDRHDGSSIRLPNQTGEFLRGNLIPKKTNLLPVLHPLGKGNWLQKNLSTEVEKSFPYHTDKDYENNLPSFLPTRKQCGKSRKLTATTWGLNLREQVQAGNVSSGSDESTDVFLPPHINYFPTVGGAFCGPGPDTGRLPSEQQATDANDPDKMVPDACPYAITPNHKCTHFPCVQPYTYHSLGFHPDTSTHSWRDWMQLTACRPHHRLAQEQAEPGMRRYRSVDDPPADAPEFNRRRRLDKEEQLRLGTMHKKLVHSLQRPPSWNTNYGQPTPYKRLKNPVRLKPLEWLN